jgi:hypothetical protein
MDGYTGLLGEQYNMNDPMWNPGPAVQVKEEPSGGGGMASFIVPAAASLAGAGVGSLGGKAAAKAQERSNAAALEFAKQQDAEKQQRFDAAQKLAEQQYNAWENLRERLLRRLGFDIGGAAAGGAGGGIPGMMTATGVPVAAGGQMMATAAPMVAGAAAPMLGGATAPTPNGSTVADIIEGLPSIRMQDLARRWQAQ